MVVDVSDAPTDTDEAAAAAELVDAASEALCACSDALADARATVAQIQQQLAGEVAPDTLRELSSKIPVVYGEVSRLETRVDAVAVGSIASEAADAARSKRKKLIEASASLAEEVQQLAPLLARRTSEVADARKAAGNKHFKAGAYEQASRCYSEAISIDRKNAVYLTNRCACYMAREKWREAAADAKECLALDVGSVKGYIFLTKCQLRLGQARDAAKALGSAPLGLLGAHAELAAQSKAVQEELKAAGNAAFKAGRHGEAEELYTHAISLDGSNPNPNPVFYSNRCAVHQARRQWREAAADAARCIKIDSLFVKGYIHLGKVHLAQGQHAEAVCRRAL